MEPLRAEDPREVGPYLLQCRLGGGGMGRVFLGQSRSGRQVAVKLIRPEHAEDPQFRDRFAREVDAARRVSAFYTAAVVDADAAADPPWLATAYVSGPSLQEAVAHRPLSPMTIRVLGADLAEGLAGIHASALVHCDLKPSNVILAKDAARVIDFGIARALDATSPTAAHTVMGTAPFMSPEQARGRMIGPPSDVFTLGSVLVFAATGRSPFGSGPAQAVLHRVANEDPDLAGLPAALADLASACLAKSPNDRPTVTDILDWLAVTATLRAHWWPPPEITEMITGRTAAITRQLPSGPNAATNSTASKPQRSPHRRAHTSISPVTFQADWRSRMIGGGVGGAILALILAGFWVAAAIPSSMILGLMALIVVFGVTIALLLPYDVITMDADGLYISRERLLPAKNCSIPWQNLREVTMVGDGSHARIVVWFRPGRGPAKLPPKRQFKGGLVVAAPAAATWPIGKKKRIRAVHNALTQFATDIYVDRVR